MMKRTVIGAAALTLTLAMSACATNEQQVEAAGDAPSATLTGKGASSMAAAQKQWAADFQEANPSITVNYSPEGSGAGREAFINGAAAFAGSDRALKDEEMGPGKFAGCAADSDALNLPVYISPIAVIFNVEGVAELKLDPDTLAGIFSGEITNWNDGRIAATNPDATLPDAAITAVHRSDDSGTTENFVDFLSATAPTVWTEEVSGTWPAPYSGEAAQGTSGVVNSVATGKNTIGYADASQAGELGVAAIKVGDTFLAPTADAAAMIVDAAPRVEGRAEHDRALKLDRTAAGAYPAVLVSYAVTCQEYADPAEAALVKDYLGYVVSPEGQESAQQSAGSAPLSPTMQQSIRAAIDSIS